MSVAALIASARLFATGADGQFAAVRIDCDLTERLDRGRSGSSSLKETILFIENERPFQANQKVIVLRTLDDGRSWLETANASMRPEAPNAPYAIDVTYTDGSQAFLNSDKTDGRGHYNRIAALTDGAGPARFDGTCQITMEADK